MNYEKLNSVLRFGATPDRHVLADLVSQLASPQHNRTRWGQGDEDGKTLRMALSDALHDAGRHEESELVGDHTRHVIVRKGEIKPGRFTARHISDVREELNGFLHTVSDGQFDPDAAHFHEDRPDSMIRRGFYTYALTHYHDRDGFLSPIPHGHVRVVHWNTGDAELHDHADVHYSELGHHLADAIREQVNQIGDDWDWDTPTVNTHIGDTNVDSHRLGQLPLGSTDRLNELYHGHDLSPWYLDQAIHEAEQHRDRFHREAAQHEDNDEYDTEAHDRLAAAEHVLNGLREHRDSLGGLNQAHFETLLNRLRSAPYEEEDK